MTQSPTPGEGSEPAASAAREDARVLLDGPLDLHRLLVESVRDYAIFVLSPTGHVASWNTGARRIKGYTAEEIIGRHFSDFYPEADRVADKPGWELRVAERDGRVEDEGWRIRKDGTRFWANVVITALRDEAGKLVGFAKVTRDLSERRAAEERAIADARRVAAAEAANRAKSEFLTSMSHELRTPLNAIGGYVDLLLAGVRGPLSDAVVADLVRVQVAQTHLLGLINDLLNFSRIEAGQISYASEPVPLKVALEAVRGMMEPQAALRSITLAWPTEGMDLVARADMARTEQILLNLLTNAVKYTEAGGRVEVTIGREGPDVWVGVADTGLGIPEDRLEAIFEPFVQVGRTLSSTHEGTGLGLAISRDLARGMGGELSVQSVEGAGSTFTLRLPGDTSAAAEG